MPTPNALSSRGAWDVHRAYHNAKGETMTGKEKREAKEHASEMLAKYVSKGDTLYTIVRSVSRSGMSRKIDVFAIRDNEPVWLSAYVARVLDWPITNDGIRVSGCGMDMCFHTIYTLAHHLFGDGYALTNRNI